MERRRFLAAIGTISATSALAGCTVHLPKPGEPTLDYTVASSSFVGSGFQPTVVVIGEVTNSGEVFVEDATLECRLVDGDGQTIDQRTRPIEKIEQGETQQYAFEFPISASDVAAFDHAEITITYPDSEE